MLFALGSSFQLGPRSWFNTDYPGLRHEGVGKFIPSRALKVYSKVSREYLKKIFIFIASDKE